MAIQSLRLPGPLSKIISIGSPKVYSDFETLMTGFSGITSSAILNELLAKTVKLSSSKK